MSMISTPPKTSISPIKEEPSQQGQRLDAKHLDIILFPRTYRKLTYKPLPWYLMAALMLSISQMTSPWLEYSMLDEGEGYHSTYRTTVFTSLYEKCKTDEENHWSCKTLDMLALQIFVNVGLALCLASLALSMTQSVKQTTTETAAHMTPSIPAILVWAFAAAVASAIGSIVIFTCLTYFKITEGGGASFGFFIQGAGLMFLMVGTKRAWQVAIAPALVDHWAIIEKNYISDSDSDDRDQQQETTRQNKKLLRDSKLESLESQMTANKITWQ